MFEKLRGSHTSWNGCRWKMLDIEIISKYQEHCLWLSSHWLSQKQKCLDMFFLMSKICWSLGCNPTNGATVAGIPSVVSPAEHCLMLWVTAALRSDFQPKWVIESQNTRRPNQPLQGLMRGFNHALINQSCFQIRACVCQVEVLWQWDMLETPQKGTLNDEYSQYWLKSISVITTQM